MSKLTELRQLVADMFKDAESKEQIETFATLNNKINEASKEQDDLISQNVELVKSYKDLVQHTSFNDTSTKPLNTDNGEVSFEDALARFIENNKN